MLSTTSRATRLLKSSRILRSVVTRAYKQGDSASLTKVFSGEDVKQFSEISLDSNPVHIDEEYARTSRFGRCIVHGVLLNGLVSAVCSTKLPGPGAVYLSQTTQFLAPAFVGDSVTAEVEVLSVDRIVMTCSTVVKETDSQKVLMTGEAKIMLPKRKK